MILFPRETSSYCAMIFDEKKKTVKVFSQTYRNFNQNFNLMKLWRHTLAKNFWLINHKKLCKNSAIPHVPLFYRLKLNVILHKAHEVYKEARGGFSLSLMHA